MGTDQALDMLGTRRKLGRASRYPGQLWQVPTFVLGVCLFLLVAISSPLRQDWSSDDVLEEMAELRRNLEAGAEKPEIVALQAENLLAHAHLVPRRAAEVQFLAGSAYYRLAQALPDRDADATCVRATHHLEKALTLGPNIDDQLRASDYLGALLFRQDKSSRRALDLLFTSVDKGADNPAQGYGLLAQAYLHMPAPNLDAALSASQKQLELVNDGD